MPLRSHKPGNIGQRSRHAIELVLHRLIMIAWAGLFPPAAVLGEGPPVFASGDTVSIQADEAWEDEQPDIVHFDGHFLMRAGNWSVSADQATLYGKLDDPKTLVLLGAPARVLVIENVSGQDREISGTAPEIEYQRTTNVVTLHGGAVLSRNGEVLSSEEIRYDIDLDQYQAQGPGGVRIEVEPGH